jgi:hypothetical protein
MASPPAPRECRALRKMKTIISLILIGVGVVLLIDGIHAANSLGSGFSRFFTGAPMDKSLWLLIGGVITLAIGAAGLVRRARSNKYHTPPKP